MFATTRIRACEEAEHEKQNEVMQTIEGAKPTSLETIVDNTPHLEDCMDIDLSNFCNGDASSAEAEVDDCDVCVDDFSISSSSNCFDNLLNSKSLVSLLSVNFDGLTKMEFVHMQNDDDSLTQLWVWPRHGQKNVFCFRWSVVVPDLNYGSYITCHCCPQARKQVLTLAHEGQLCTCVFTSALRLGHVKCELIKVRVVDMPKWLGQTCLKCNKDHVPKAPLCKPEILVERFEKLALDVVGPLPSQSKDIDSCSYGPFIGISICLASERVYCQ